VAVASCALALLAGGWAVPAASAQVAAGPIYGVVEIAFRGPTFGPTDAPARDVDFWVRVGHESGSPTYRIHGFWDGDGRGGVRGNVFKVRFTPTKPGRWTLAEVHSDRPELNGEKEGDQVVATPSALHGFWEVDAGSAGRRWYRRSDGSHPYLVGNTHYSFISETYLNGKPNGSDIATDVRRNARYFRKLRFSPIGDRYPNPTAAPFLDDAGKPTYDGDYSFRPNPAWFHRRVDLAVRTAFETDLVADLILSGVDTEDARSALGPGHNGGDPAPYLKYMAARYGAYPNVWFCLINEYDIQTPRYTPEQIRRDGHLLRGYLTYPSPISVHRSGGPWPTALNDEPSWNDHVIVQEKLRDLSDAADFLIESYRRGGADRPIVDDELSYEGAGDKHSEYDTIEALLGAFLGGGYGTTGYKSANKLGQYFAGNFDASLHTAADNLAWMREAIDRDVTFWRMQPVPLERSIFTGADPGFRAMAWPGNEYVLGTDAPHPHLTARLPAGSWTVTRYDVIARRQTTLRRAARGNFTFDAPDSRAVLFHFRKNPG
jgi:hypothetical protein